MKKYWQLGFGIAAAILASVLLPGIAWAQGASAQKPADANKPVYAVLSLIGDKLDIVVATSQTGTNIDPNRRSSIAIAESVFDDTVVSSVAAAVRRIKPAAELSALNTRSPILFEKYRTLFALKDETIAIPDAVRAALKAQAATHLFLVTKHRDDASAQFRDGTIEGKGKLEGLGYYLDGSFETSGPGGQSGRGFIAPFAYFNIALIDLATSKQLKRQKITASWPVSAGYAVEDIASPWAALSSAEKVRLVNMLIDREINRVMPDLLR